MKTNPSPQRGPAIALAQLLTDHPELHRVRWSLCPDGMLMGSAMHLDVDVRPLMAAFAEVLGGSPLEATDRMEGRDEQFTSWLYATWRDVPLSVTLGCSAQLTAAPMCLTAGGSMTGVA